MNHWLGLASRLTVWATPVLIATALVLLPTCGPNCGTSFTSTGTGTAAATGANCTATAQEQGAACTTAKANANAGATCPHAGDPAAYTFSRRIDYGTGCTYATTAVGDQCTVKATVTGNYNCCDQ